jgi:hypothetical protein
MRPNRAKPSSRVPKSPICNGHNHVVTRHKPQKAETIKNHKKHQIHKEMNIALAKNFPWAREVREYKRTNFSITKYADGSRLYLFKNGGYLIITPEGSGILKQNPRMIKDYLRGEKFPINAGGNSTISVMRTRDQPLVVKEHHSGLSARTQMEHMKQIKESFVRARSDHSAPTYYAVSSIPRDVEIRSRGSNRKVVDVSVMDLVSGQKLSTVVEELKAKGDHRSMHKMSRMLDDYKAFKKYLKRKKMPITDLHEGNVMAVYDEKSRRYRFTIIDQ